MVDRELFGGTFKSPYEDTDPYSDGVGALDYGKSLFGRTVGIGADLGATVRALGESNIDPEEKSGRATMYLGKLIQNFFGGVEDATYESMSPSAQRAMQASFTDPNFWTLASLALKTTGMVPDIAAAAIPAALLPGAGWATAVAATQGGVLSAAAVTDELYKITDEMTDAELVEQVPMYRELRESGMDEENARILWNKEFRGLKPVVTGLIGTIAGAVGPAGQAARMASGAGRVSATGASGGAVRRVGGAFLEGGLAEGVQNTSEAAAIQSAEVEAGFRDDYDIGELAEAAGEGFVLGGILGGGMGAMSRGRGADEVREASKADTSSTAPNQPGSTPPAQGPDMTTAGGEPRTTAQVSDAVDAVAPEVAAPAGEVSIVEGAAPDAAQTVALQASKPEAVAPMEPEVTVPPVTPEGNVQEAGVPVEPAVPPEAQSTPQVADASPEAAVGRPDPMQETVQAPVQEPVPAAAAPVSARPVEPAGPRILEDRSAPDYREQWASRVSDNIAQAEVPVISEPAGRKRSEAEIQRRAAVREGAADIAQRYPPQEIEMNILSTRPKEVQEARRAMHDRVKVISKEADEMGLELPKAFRDNANPEMNYNPETLLLMEARRLANKKSPSIADFRRFFERELSVRVGEVEQAVAERRAEGDLAYRQEAFIDEGEASPTTPEDTVIAAEREGQLSKGAEPSKKIPPRIQKAIDDAIGHGMVAGASKSTPQVVVARPRKIRKPEAKPAAKPEAKPAAKPEATPPLAGEGKKAVTPKVKEVQERAKSLAEKAKARVVAARAETNTKPTEAQKQAGNYKKGAVSLHGMTVRIENPKGSSRSGVDQSGTEWSVKMRHDYGYIEGTKGADGDAVDVYLGDAHDASYVYVVDQLDADTRAFDEHKALMGFKDDAAAFRAYERSFSDGRGLDRMGGMRRMTMQEFRAWLDTDPSERASLSDRDAAEIRAFLAEEALNPSLPQKVTTVRPEAVVIPEGAVADPYSGRIVRPVASQPAAQAMGTLNLSNLNPYQRAIAGQARRMLTELVGDTPVHFVTEAELSRLTGREGVKGVFSAGADGKEAVFVRSDLMGDPDALRHAVLHEVAHAATIRAVLTDPAIEGNILDVMASTVDAINDLQVVDNGALDYALGDATEFVAEVLSNPHAQELLAQMQAPDALVQKLGMARGRIRTAWDALVHTIRRALRLPETTTTMLEAALRVTEPAMAPRMQTGQVAQSFLINGNLKPLQTAVTDRIDTMLKRPELQPSSGKPWNLRLRPFDSLARAADAIFGGQDSNPVRKIAQLVEMQRTRANKHYEDATPLLRKAHDLQKVYEKVQGENGQSVWENFAALTIDETTSGVFANLPLSEQKHIRAGARDAWQRAQHPELARRYRLLPEDLKALRQEMLDFFKTNQQALSKGIMENQISKLFDTDGVEGGAKGLAERIHNRTATEADKALLGDAYDAIAQAGVLSRIDGPYFPLMRRGNWVLVAHNKVTSPGNARAISPTEFEFTTERDAEAFAAKQEGRPNVTTVYVDPATGETFGVEDGQQVRLTAQDMNAEKRYRVAVNNRVVEMFDSQTEARAAAAEYANAGLVVDDIVPRNFDNYGAQAEALSPQIMRMMNTLERRADARGLAPEQKETMLRALNEMSLQFMVGTRIQTRSLPRRNIAGASKDITRNTHEYAIAMGNHLAKVEIGPQIDAQMQVARDYIDNNRRTDNMNGARQSVYNEVARRVTTTDPRTDGGKFGAFVDRTLAVSFIDKLMSPSYSVINATQPMMITMPYLAGNYGVGRAWGAMSKAYNDVGSLRSIMRGFKDTMMKARSGSIIPTDPVSLIRSRLTNPREQEAIDFWVERGALDTDAGLEVSKLIQDRKGVLGKFDVGLGWLEGVARQMPKAVEAINRSVSGLAAYRLEMERSGDHVRAMEFAYDTINRTQFNYSYSNAAPYMNSPMLRIMTQFKKFGVGMYSFLGEQAGIAIDSTRTPQERRAAIKSLSYTIGMHVAVAGAMGLPTEPIKMVVTVANALGVIDWSWEDVEIGQREIMADIFGKDVGMALSRGIPRLAGVDLSTRMGIDSLVGPFGEPRSNETQDLKAYMWDAVAGAPAGLIIDVTKGVGLMAGGEVTRSLEYLVPVKVFSDTLKSYRQMTEGSVSMKSKRQVMSPYSVGEAVTRSLGFTPAREAEAFERSNMFYHKRSSQEETRRDFMREWTEANGAARGRIWREIQAWNKRQPREARLSLPDLRNYSVRLKRDAKETREGLRARRREQHILKRADRTFKFEP